MFVDVFRSHLGLYSKPVCIVVVYIREESRGFLKDLDVLPKGLEYALLTTELAAQTCHDTGSGKHRLCLRSELSHIFPDCTR